MLARRLISVLLVALIVYTMILSGCSDGGSESSKADAYLEMAQEYVDDGDYASALEVLKKGYDNTGDERIAVMIVELMEQQGEIEETPEESTSEINMPEDSYTIFQPILEQAYQEYGGYGSYCRYALYDCALGSDPELILITGTCEADYKASIYVIEGDAAFCFGEFYCCHGSVCGLYGGSGLAMISGQQGVERVVYVTVDYGGLYEEELFSGVVEDYHPLEELAFYDLTDMDGLFWVGNAYNNNLAVLESIKQEGLMRSNDIIDSLNSDERYEINIFLSNFCEQQFIAYPASDYDMLNFAFKYSVINAPGLLSYEDSVACMSKSNMNALLYRFFGKTIEPSSSTAYFHGADGETISFEGEDFKFAMEPLDYTGYVAITRGMIDHQDGTYDVGFAVYCAADSDSLQELYSLHEREISTISEVTCVGYGTAVVKEYTTDNGRQTYQLLSYSGPQVNQSSESSSSNNLIHGFSSSQRHTINVFLSNFCEQFMSEYPTSNYRMLMFAHLYAKINAFELLSMEPEHYCMKKSDVDSILMRFFGRTVSSSEAPFVYQYGSFVDEILFEDGKYKFIAADGESYNDIANVYEMVSNGDGTYDVYFDVYAVDLMIYDSEDLGDYYDIAPGELWRYPELTYVKSGHAVVRDYITDSGYETYQLISYEVYS